MIPEDEEASEYDGFLSHLGEWHASVFGFVVGLATVLANEPALFAALVAVCLGVRGAPGPLKEVRSEPWYAMGFAVPPVVVDVTVGVVS